MPFRMHDLELCQQRVDAVAARYQALGDLLGKPFLAQQLSYDAYMARSTRLRVRMKQQLDRIQLPR